MSFVLPLTCSAKETVKVYLFKSSTCSRCAEALSFFEGLLEDEEYRSYFELVPLETNGNSEEIQENVALAKKVSSYFHETFDEVPMIVIGDKHYVGYASSMNDELTNDIITGYHNDVIDVVDGIKNGTLKSSNFGTIMALIVVVVLVGGLGYLIYVGRKSTDNLLEETSEETTKKKTKK